jgi:hypothetical protein
MIEEGFLQIGERNGPKSVAAAAEQAAATTTTGLPWRLPFIKHLQTKKANLALNGVSFGCPKP